MKFHGHSIAGVLLMGAALLGCAQTPPKAPTAKRSVDEGRATKVISEALQKEGLEPGAARTIPVAGGKQITLDVTVSGKKLGIAYLSANDVFELGDNPIATKKQLPGDPLRIENGVGGDSGTHYVILYASDYPFDDTEGVSHETTVITAENKLTRDVRDFVTIARRERFE